MRPQRKVWVRTGVTNALELGGHRVGSPAFAQHPEPQLIVSGDEGRVCDANRAAEVLFRAHGEVVGARYAELVGTTLPTPARNSVEHTVTVGAGRWFTVTHTPLAEFEGDRRWVLVSLRALSDGSSSVALAEARRETERLTHALAISEERTRARIATELHDDIGQLLAVVQLKLQGLAAETELAQVGVQARCIEALVSTAARVVRSTTFDLTSPVLQQLGFDAAIASLGEVVSRMSGISFHQRCTIAPTLGTDARGVVYRVVRELIHNVQKHARAKNIWVESARAGETFVISVRDDGCGCDIDLDRARCTTEGGYGLTSSLAQMRGLGGNLQLRRAAPIGTEAILTIPLSGSSVRSRNDVVSLLEV